MTYTTKKVIRHILVESLWWVYGRFWHLGWMTVARRVWAGYWWAHCLWPETRYPRDLVHLLPWMKGGR